MTREMLDDLLVDVSRQVVPDVDAAWQKGLRRRRRRAATWAAAAAVVAVGLLTGLHSSTSASRLEPAGSSAVVEGHPARVSRPLSLPTMPDRPGPMAGVFSYGDDQWAVVAASGRSWQVPGVTDVDSFQPALSDDGTKLAWLRAGPGGRQDEATYVVADLVTGERREFPEIGDNAGLITQPYWIQGQIPSFWSPDNRWLLLYASREDSDVATALLVNLSGETRELPRLGHIAGWVGSDHIAWLEPDWTVIVTDLDGNETSRVTLDTEGEGSDSQWTARVSPDGATVAVLPGGGYGAAPLTTFSLSTGAPIDEAADLKDPASFSSPLWAGDRPAAWVGDSIVDVRTGDELVSLSGRWDPTGEEPSAGYWAADALGGESSSTVGIRLDWRYWSFLWWWKEILGGLLLLAVLAGLVRVFRWSGRQPPAPRRPDSVDWWGGEAT